jgi:hypothetical protein
MEMIMRIGEEEKKLGEMGNIITGKTQEQQILLLERI